MLSLYLGLKYEQLPGVLVKCIATEIRCDDVFDCGRFDRGLNDPLLVNCGTGVECFDNGVLVEEGLFEGCC